MVIANDQKARNEIAKISLLMKAEKKDIIEGIWEIYGLWSDSNLPMNDTYYLIVGIASETDQIKKNKARQYFSKEFLEKQDAWEKEYLNSEKSSIDKLVEELIQIPIVEEEEYPYPSQ